jgi:hypothetical protein
VTGVEEARLFTVEEADALLPELREALGRIREARQVVLRGAEHLARTAPLNGGATPTPEYWEASRTLRRDVERITGMGIVLRDAEAGLLDFPADRDGQLVFLCWRVDEPAVGWWHTPEGGFASRRPL